MARKWLAEIRNEKGLSQAKAAELAGLSQSYYASIETGARGKPLNVDVAKQIAMVLEFNWTRFFEDEEQDAS